MFPAHTVPWSIRIGTRVHWVHLIIFSSCRTNEVLNIYYYLKNWGKKRDISGYYLFCFCRTVACRLSSASFCPVLRPGPCLSLGPFPCPGLVPDLVPDLCRDPDLVPSLAFQSASLLFHLWHQLRKNNIKHENVYKNNSWTVKTKLLICYRKAGASKLFELRAKITKLKLFWGQNVFIFPIIVNFLSF